MRNPARLAPIALLTLAAAVTACYAPPLRVAGPAGCGQDAGPAVVQVVNQVRADRAIALLRADARLGRAARRHTSDMALNGFLGHTGSDDSTVGRRALEAEYPTARVGEVVAAGCRTAVEVVEVWLRSRRHRDILLDPAFVHVGAACVPDARGALYWGAVLGIEP